MASLGNVHLPLLQVARLLPPEIWAWACHRISARTVSIILGALLQTSKTLMKLRLLEIKLLWYAEL
jgi:hypothetical protein